MRDVHKIIPQEGNVLCVEVSGKLTQQDYDDLIPSWEAVIARHGKMRLLFVMRDFSGWEPRAAWDDFRFDREYGAKVERVAMVGDKNWQEWICKLGGLFTRTEVRYFDLTDLAAAEQWIRSG